MNDLIKELFDRASQLRDRVNVRRRHRILARDRRTFNTLCSAMDVVGDTSHALREYLAHTPIAAEDKGRAYLLAYGVLQALYLQQDALFWWGKSLDLAPFAEFKKPGHWVSSIPPLSAARTARNNSVGHPVRRDVAQPIASFFIVQHSLSADGFQLLQTDEDAGVEWITVSVRSLVEGQVRTVINILTSAVKEIDQRDAEHRRTFMNRKP